LNRRLEQIGALEEERALLGKEKREAFVRRDLRGVGLDLREIGFDGEVDRVVGIRVYLTSIPTCGFTPSSTSGAPTTSSRGCASALALT
jgi:hypothetical protein